MNNNKFIIKTRNVLRPGFDEKRLCANGLECIETKTLQECILVFGINPAGDEEDAINEENSSYLYYLPNKNIEHRTYQKFYKPIFEAISIATNNNAKWGWCNYGSCQINDIINNDNILKPHFKIINDYYNEYKDKKYSIYVSEFFYYHMTSQKEFLNNLVDSSNLHDYFVDMLNMHIDEIVDRNNNVSFIYINNATASKYLCKALNNNDYDSFIDYQYKGNTYRVFFGSMLSGQRSMDVFSKDRLINEMKEYLNKE